MQSAAAALSRDPAVTDGLPALIESLSAQPVTGGDWLVRVQVAARVLAGCGDLALLARVEGEICALAGYVDAGGQTLVRAPDRIEDGARARRRLRVPEAAAPARLTLECGREAGPLAGSHEALILPWPLGASPGLALLLLPGEGARLPQLSTADGLALVAVATNLLRRTEKLALIDAAAWIDDQIERIALLQNLLQPLELTEATGVRFAVFSRPHAYAGGDYYDVSVLHSMAARGAAETCAIALADVSGHGPAAVVETAMIDSILRTYADFAPREPRPGPASVLDYLNRHMFTRRPRPSFATMFAANWLPARGVLRYALAGHPPPLLRRGAANTVAPLHAGDGIPLQVLREFRWEETELTLGRGDLLLAYTDGVTEALSPAGVQFGVRRLRAVLAGAPPQPDAVLANVVAALDEHAAGRPFHDDQTLLVAQFS